MLSINNLPPLVKKRKTIGRGGSRGGTSGKGHKGQKARTGGASKVRSVFEGGQTPLVRRLPKRGFNNTLFAPEITIINLDVLERIFENDALVNSQLLQEKGLISKKKTLIKILGRGSLSKKLTVHAYSFSESAQRAIKTAGGACIINEENK